MTNFLQRLCLALLMSGGLLAAAAAPAAATLPLCRPVSTTGLTQARPAMELYRRAHYGEAFAQLSQLAEAGNLYAQNQLAIMYNRGLGIARDYAAAVEWWHRAADGGQTTAQCNLGIMYLYGQGVPQNDVLAYVYFNAAAARGSKDARRNRDMMEAWRMTASELDKAHELSHDWSNGQ
jgi:TPR repeat protein